MLLAAGYILWMIQRVFFGPADERWSDLQPRVHWWEQTPVFMLGALILVLGVYPTWLIDVMEQGVVPISERF